MDTNAKYCNLTVESANGNFCASGNVAIMDNPAGDLFATDWADQVQCWEHLQDKHAQMKPLGTCKVDLILGVDYGLFHWCIGEVGDNEKDFVPAARLMPAGPTHTGDEFDGVSALVAASFEAVGVLRHPLPSLTLISPSGCDGLGANPAALVDRARVEHEVGLLCQRSAGILINAEDRKVVQKIANSYLKAESGRMEVEPLWSSQLRPPSNYNQAAADWKKKRSLNRSGVFPEYEKVFKEWLDNGYIEKVVGDSRESGVSSPTSP